VKQLRGTRAALLAALALALLAPRAEAKSFSFPVVSIAATVLPNGDMQVVEDRTFAFHGSYHWAEYTLPPTPGVTIRDFAIREGNTIYQQSDSQSAGTVAWNALNGGLDARWYYSASNEQRTFTISYTVEGAAVAHPDAAELYWKFIGTGWAPGTDSVRVLITLPPGAQKSELRAWAHGSLWGNIAIEDGQHITLALEQLPGNTWVEARVIFPNRLLTNPRRRSRDDIIPYALSQEQEWAGEANATRARARDELTDSRVDLSRRITLVRYLLPLAAVILVLVIVAWVTAFNRYGKEHRPDFDGMYFREAVPGYTPAQAAMLLQWGAVPDQAITATMLDLIRRGVIAVEMRSEVRPVLLGLLGEKLKRSYVFTRRDHTDAAARAGALSASEKYLMEEWFDTMGDGTKVSLDDLLEYAKAHRMDVYNDFKEWKRLVQLENTMQITERPSETAMGLTVAGGILLLVVTAGLGAIGLPVAGVLPYGIPIVVGLGLVGLFSVATSPLMRRRTQQAANDTARWQAYRRFLNDFSNIKDMPAPAVVLWEEYLVYGTALGVATEVIKSLEKAYPHMPEMSQSPLLMLATTQGPGSMDGMSALSHLTSSFSQTMAIAASSPSSGGGFGGGFSGGGGGGGGGSGGGAG